MMVVVVEIWLYRISKKQNGKKLWQDFKFSYNQLEPPILSWLQPRKNNCVPTEFDVSISATDRNIQCGARRDAEQCPSVANKTNKLA